MPYVNLIKNLRERAAEPIPDTVVKNLQPSDFPAIEAFQSSTLTQRPYAFDFSVTGERAVISLRLTGTSFLQDQSTGKCMLVQPGTVIFYRPGDFRTIFGRGKCTSVFIATDSLAVTNGGLLSSLLVDGNLVSNIDLDTDSAVKDVLELFEQESRWSFFKFAAAFYSLADRTHSAQSLARVPQGVFAKLFAAVHDNPAAKWSNETAAEFSGYSVYHFSRKFRSEIGNGFLEFVNSLRAVRMVELMFESGEAPDVAAAKLGFSSVESASRTIRDEFGFTVPEISAVLQSKPGSFARKA